MYLRRSCQSLAVFLLFVLGLSGCGSLGTPVSITNRPLSEQMEDRAAEQVSTTAPELDDTGEAQGTPEAIAFSDALAAGNFIRLNVSTNGVDTVLRSGPGTSYEELTSLADGVEVLATGDQTGEWVYVVYGSLEGWVSNRRIVFSDGTSEPVVIQADEIEETYVVYEVHGNVVGVNMRAAANGQAQLVTGAPTGSQVVGTGRTDGSWIEVRYNGVTGWSSGTYLRPVGTQTGSDE